ncbi:phosphoserine phosphatase SerB [Altererythrobacter sp. MF3-039]|uniref:phosphoserine phosphatase SerB n=1 Tax=Altererythrobacter sp. MF3-039 TaxID=3252901 RepID=UPI00390C5CD1
MVIARVIADPAQNNSGLEARLDAATAALGDQGISIAAVSMLHDARDVLQIMLPDAEIGGVSKVLSEVFAPCDLLLSEGDIAVPQLFVSDMDSTMIGQECIDELADYAGLKDRIAEITERAMQGELDFERALRERVGLLAGLEESAIDRCLAERITPMEGARKLVGTLKAKGCRTILVTGGFHHFADPIAELLGFDRVVGNRLAVKDGKLTGQLLGAITDSSVKRRVLLDELGELGEEAISLATGDGANDIPMLEAATFGVAYHAKPKAREASNGQINRGDLISVLKLFGIPETDWVIS